MDSFSIRPIRIVDTPGNETIREVVPTIWNIDGLVIFGLGIHMPESYVPTSRVLCYKFWSTTTPEVVGEGKDRVLILRAAKQLGSVGRHWICRKRCGKLGIASEVWYYIGAC